MKILESSRISCQAHDYVEIVCMRGSKVLLHLSTGEQCQGVAEDIIRAGDIETMRLQTATGARTVDLAVIETLEARDNPVEAHNFIIRLSSA